MILATRHGNVERRSDPFANRSNLPTFYGRWGGLSVAGPVVNVDTAAGLPTVSDALRLIAESIAMVPCIVYSGDPLERERARETWQWTLLHEQANDDNSAYDFFCDVATSLETDGNAYIWKMKVDPRRVEALWVLDPQQVQVKRDERNRKVFEVVMNGRPERFTADTILHIRGWTTKPGSDTGVSTIGLHREALGRALATEEFESRFYKNGAHSGLAIQVQGRPATKDVEEMRQWFMDKHSGLSNAHKPAILYNGATVEQLGLSLEDAQFIESRRFTVEEMARMLRISAVGMLAPIENARTNDDFERFLKVDLAPRFRRIEMALKSDPDLFGTSDLFPEFLADAVLRPDIKTRYEAYRQARQGGWMTPNDIRRLENLPPADGGDDIQVTPVGGAPNAGAGAAAVPSQPSEGDNDG